MHLKLHQKAKARVTKDKPSRRVSAEDPEPPNEPPCSSAGADVGSDTFYSAHRVYLA